MSVTRKVLFSFIAIVVIPALFFLLLEFGLRLAGFGKSFNYFTPLTIDGEDYFQDNPVFVQQFYPASLDIIPLENTFAAKHDPQVLRVFVLGGSAARGFPNPAHGFGRQLETLLGHALPGRRVEVVNTAMTAINSHVVYETARSIPKGSADFAIVLMGNNEVIGPYGPGTFNQNFLSSLEAIRFLQTLKRSRIGQLLATLTTSINPRDHRQELEWKGMQMFTEESVPITDPRLQTVYDHYRDNLKDIVGILQSKGAHVVLSSVPVNLRHSAPFSSVHSPGLPQAQMARWDDIIQRAHASVQRQDWQSAIADYRAALAIDAGHADTHFRLATSYEGADQFDQAAAHYRQARDLDALRFRADSRINDLVRAIASGDARDNLSFVDAEAAFGQSSRPLQPGWDLFLEHVHYNFSGDYLLARSFAEAILRALGTGQVALLPESEVAQRVGYPSNMTVKVMERVVSMVQSPPFTGQSNQADLEKLITTERQDVERRLGSIDEQIARRQRVLQSGRGDWRLRYELAYLYEHVGNRAATYQQLYQLDREYPHHRDSLVMLAKLLHKDQRYREEIPYLQRALLYTRGDEALIAQLTGWLGLAYLRVGEDAVATELLLSLASDYPAQTHYVIQAYATLVRHARQSGNTDLVDRYATAANRYAERAIKAGQDQAYPLLYKKMAQLMRLAGDDAGARQWQARAPAPGNEGRPPGS